MDKRASTKYLLARAHLFSCRLGSPLLLLSAFSQENLKPWRKRISDGLYLHIQGFISSTRDRPISASGQASFWKYTELLKFMFIGWSLSLCIIDHFTSLPSAYRGHVSSLSTTCLIPQTRASHSLESVKPQPLLFFLFFPEKIDGF